MDIYHHIRKYLLFKKTSIKGLLNGIKLAKKWFKLQLKKQEKTKYSLQ